MFLLIPFEYFRTNKYEASNFILILPRTDATKMFANRTNACFLQC